MLVAVVAVPSVAVAPRPLGCCRVSRASRLAFKKRGGDGRQTARCESHDRAVAFILSGTLRPISRGFPLNTQAIPEGQATRKTIYPTRNKKGRHKAKEGHRRQRTNKSRTSAVDRRSFVTTTVPGHRESRRNHRTMATNVTWHHTMSREQRERHLGQRGVTVSFEFSVATVCACG